MLEGLLGGAQAVQLQHPAGQSLCLLLEQQAAAANLVADSTSDRLSQDTAAMAIQEASQVGPSLSAEQKCSLFFADHVSKCRL